MKFENLTGQRFNRLTVVDRAENNKYGHTRWNCVCDCGNKVIAYAMDLKRGGRPSCGCLKSEKISALRKLEPGIAGRNSIYGQYRKSAKYRGIPFALTITEFTMFIDDDCHYCGVGPALKVFGEVRMATRNVNGNFTYTGIDRKDSALGYQVDNCVTCCKTCNFAKNDMPYDEFIAYLNRVAQYRSGTLKKKLA